MTDEDEKAYCEQRAEAELLLAQAADHPAVVRAHYLLAGFYLDRIYYQGGDDGGQEAELVRY
jgi:hypothetical protein